MKIVRKRFNYNVGATECISILIVLVIWVLWALWLQNIKHNMFEDNINANNEKLLLVLELQKKTFDDTKKNGDNILRMAKNQTLIVKRTNDNRQIIKYLYKNSTNSKK